MSVLLNTKLYSGGGVPVKYSELPAIAYIF
jgi:hypothetical protein